MCSWMRVFDVAGDRCGWNAEKCFHHFAAYQVGMPVFAGKFRHDSPDVLIGSLEGIAQRLNCRGPGRRAVHQRDHGRVTPVVEHFVQADLQRTELAATWVRVNHKRRAVSINNRRQRRFVLSHHHQDELSGRRERTN